MEWNIVELESFWAWTKNPVKFVLVLLFWPDNIDLQDIASIQYPDLDFSEDSIPTEVVELAIDAIRSDATSTEQLPLGCFTRFKLKRLST